MPFIAADALAPSIARSSANEVHGKQVLVIHEQGFQLPVPSQSWEIEIKCKLKF